LRLSLSPAVPVGAELGGVDLDLVSFVVDVDVLVLVSSSLLIASPLLLGRHLNV
jgi:hypothetical protein